MITNQQIAEKIQDYLQHKSPLTDLINWAENSLMEEGFETKEARDIVAKIGVADVRAFGLLWDDCERFLNQLGYTVKIEFSKVA